MDLNQTFKYDLKTHTWTRTEVTCPTIMNDCSFIHTPGGNVVTVSSLKDLDPIVCEDENGCSHQFPNFKIKNGFVVRDGYPNFKILYYKNLVPSFQVGGEHAFAYSFMTEKWYVYQGVEHPKFLYNEIMNQLLMFDQEQVKRQLAFHQSIFDHIREKASWLDEFIKLAEEHLENQRVKLVNELGGGYPG